MDKPFGRLIRSELFTFLIGPEKVLFVVNSEAIAKQSSVLHGLVNGNMLEAQSKTVVWPDVDEDTFVRFCEFCYLDNYSPPSCGWDGNTVEEAVPMGNDTQSEKLAHALESHLASTPSPPRTSKKGKKKGTLASRPKQSLEARSDLTEDQEYLLPERCTQFTEQFKPFSNVTDDQDFTPVFLGHARLYVIADKYCIEALKELVLFKLHRTLKDFTLFPKRIGDLVKLIQFVYTEDNTRGGSKQIDPLRKLVTRYMTTVLKDIAVNPAFLGLLLEGGEFVSDFWTVVWAKRGNLLRQPDICIGIN
ncbi:BTB domain-containing protein [Trichophyton interdigitale]|uniref:BTB domain-containing protein n=1 Tax=Trichophyton interdigitale TaxID=101480 RepID=A0A9P4YNV6_9EURO|nr:BTB domain-containing protein [Trichophyton interdigitale]KAF3901186.1 BTB domain-containing protein [Trichophyton interdigitale]KAG8212156.1 BTB domain-containing protein [Trichophyton interdigitale]